MNIVYVSREYGTDAQNRLGAYLDRVFGLLVAANHKVFLVTAPSPAGVLVDIPAGVAVVPTLSSLPHQAQHFFSDGQEYSYRVLHTLRSLSQKEKLDVIEFPDRGGEGFAAIRTKRLLNAFADSKLIVKGHTPLSLLFQIKAYKEIYASMYCDFEMEDYCLRQADLVTAPSLALAKYFENRVGRKDIRVCPDLIDLPARESGRTFKPEQAKTVRFFGSVEFSQGADVFVEAALRVLELDSGFRFELYGGDTSECLFGKSYSAVLASRIPERFKTQIVFAGARTQVAISNLLGSSCLCVLPWRWENWPRLCFEAMSRGCVVIGSSRGGMAEAIQPGQNGFLINPDKPQELADVILRQHRDLRFLEQLSAAAQACSRERCAPEKTAAQILENYLQPQPPRPWRRPPPKKVSVVIPFYNQGDYLAEAIQSVRNSNFPQIEIVVVNDGSSEAAANEVFEQTEGVVKVRKSNGGLSSARNAGIRAATGDFVLTLDADDKIHPDYIPAAIQALENNPGLSYLTCHAQNFGALDDPYIPVGYVPTLMPFLNTDGKCANIFRREVFETCGGYDEVLISYEDWDFLLVLHEHGLQGDVLPFEYLLYRRHLDSMVFTVADPRRVELIQYLMLKHPCLLDEDRTTDILLAGLWQWQAVRADGALKREQAMLASEPWKTYARQIAEMAADHARKVAELSADHSLKLRQLSEEQTGQIADLRAQHAAAEANFRAQLFREDTIEISTREVRGLLRKYVKRKLRALLPG